MTEITKQPASVRRNFIETNLHQPEIPSKPAVEPATLNGVINAVLSVLHTMLVVKPPVLLLKYEMGGRKPIHGQAQAFNIVVAISLLSGDHFAKYLRR